MGGRTNGASERCRRPIQEVDTEHRTRREGKEEEDSTAEKKGAQRRPYGERRTRQQKVNEFHAYLAQLVEERIAFELAQEKARHCCNIARGRVNGIMALMTKRKSRKITRRPSAMA